MAELPSLSIHVDEQTKTATLRTGRAQKPIVCKCLGQRVRNGKRHFYLDRVVHQHAEYVDHFAFGATSTVIVEKAASGVKK